MKTEPNAGVNGWEEFLDLTDNEKLAVVQWISGQTLKYLRKWSSYSMKHHFHGEGGFYMTNGAMKGAALHCGLIPVDREVLNWHFKLSNASQLKFRQP